MAMTYSSLYLDTRRTLKQAGTEAASLEAMELLACAAGKSREQLQHNMGLYVGSDMAARLKELVTRRLAGEPVPYIVGEWEFYGLTLDITRDVLIPRPDTETLAQEAIRLAKEAGSGARVLDLCAGSGCVGLAVAAHAPLCRVVLAELDEGALRVCRQNARRTGLSARVTCMEADARKKPASVLGAFDLLACNPPYIPTAEIAELDVSVRDYEPLSALDGGADGLDFYRVIIPTWAEVLRPGGALLFEVGMGQADAVAKLLEKDGYRNIALLADPRGIERVVRATVAEEQ